MKIGIPVNDFHSEVKDQSLSYDKKPTVKRACGRRLESQPETNPIAACPSWLAAVGSMTCFESGQGVSDASTLLSAGSATCTLSVRSNSSALLSWLSVKKVLTPAFNVRPARELEV